MMLDPMNEPWPLPAMDAEKAEVVMRDCLWGRVGMAISRALVVGMVDGDLVRGRYRLNHAMAALLVTDTMESRILPLFRAAEHLLPDVGPNPDDFDPTDDETESYFGVAYVALGLLLARSGAGAAAKAAAALGMPVPPWEMLPEWQARTGGQH